MQLLPVLFILSLTEARRRRPVSLERKSNQHSKFVANDVDVYPKTFGDSVDFGHVYKPGYEDLNSNQRSLYLEEEPKTLQQARQMLQKAGSDLEWTTKVEEPLGFSNPRDAMLYYNKHGQKDKFFPNRDKGRSLNQTAVVAQLNNKSIGNKINKIPNNLALPQEEVDGKENSKEQYFLKSSFDLVSGEANEIYHKANWTTCKEFAKGAVFHPDDVINIEWLPFYIWSTRPFMPAIVHIFSYPTKKLVQQYKETFGPFLNMKVDWEQPKLLMKELSEMLLIAGDRKGLFYGIPNIELPTSARSLQIKIPVQTIRLKIVDPYIALMYCNERFATIMTVVGTEPPTAEEKTAAAGILKFVGMGYPAIRDVKLQRRITKYERENKIKEEKLKEIKNKKPTILRE